MPYTASTAESLQVALRDPKREPFPAFYHWTLLHPPARIQSDYEDQKIICNTIAKLWNRIRENRVRNRADLEKWFMEALEIEVRHTVHIPGADIEVAHKDRYTVLTDRHMSLKEHPWMERVSNVLKIAPVMLEVGSTSIACTWTNRFIRLGVRAVQGKWPGAV